MQNPCAEFFEKWFRTAVDSSEIIAAGASGPHVSNITKALAHLGYRVRSSGLYDEETVKAIAKFQEFQHHRNVDGMIGPGTRQLLTTLSLEKLGPEFFGQLEPTYSPFYRVFISYAWNDTQRVNKIDQWLRDHAISVSRDIRDFKAGEQLPQEIEKNLNLADKAIIVYSPESQSRDWPAFERVAAEKVEALRHTSYLVYLLLDGIRPPKHDVHRIYVDASSKPLKVVGQELVHAIAKVGQIPETYSYDENQPV